MFDVVKVCEDAGKLWKTQDVACHASETKYPHTG